MYFIVVYFIIVYFIIVYFIIVYFIILYFIIVKTSGENFWGKYYRKHVDILPAGTASGEHICGKQRLFYFFDI